MIEKGLYGYLTSIAGLVDTRVYPVKSPEQAILPLITYQRTGNEFLMTMDGKDTLEHTSITVDMWSSQYLEAKQLAETLKAAINGYKGMWFPFEVQGVFVSGEEDGYVEPQFAEEVGFHRSTIFLEIWWSNE